MGYVGGFCCVYELVEGVVSYIYRSARLSDIHIIMCVTLQFIYPTWIFISWLFG